MDFKNSNLNPLALENATEIALFTEYLELAWCLFEKFTCLRPHFFWPILLSTGRSDGESGERTFKFNFFKLFKSTDFLLDLALLQIFGFELYKFNSIPFLTFSNY